MEEYNKYTLRNITYETEVPVGEEGKTAIIRAYNHSEGSILKEKKVELKNSAKMDCFGKICLTETDSNKLEESLLDLIEEINK